MKVSSIKPNPQNPRTIKDANFEKLCKSIQDFPAMMELRPIVTDADGMVLGGNMRLKAIQHLGLKDIPDTWVKRADQLTPDEQRRFIIADNVSGGDWDIEDLAANWDNDELSEWGLELEWPVDEKEISIDYSKKVEIPTYEPKNEKPEITILYNTDKYKEIVKKIENSAVPEDVKIMLKVAASRHIVFNYENMADFYAHSDKEIQKLMEDSALVIIDFNRAIELGFVKLSDQIANQYKQEHE